MNDKRYIKSETMIQKAFKKHTCQVSLLDGRLPIFDLISLLNIHLLPNTEKLALLGANFIPIIFPIEKNKLQFGIYLESFIGSMKCTDFLIQQFFCINNFSIRKSEFSFIRNSGYTSIHRKIITCTH